MQEFIHWSLDAIRAKGANYSWMEELRFEWATPTAKLLASILEGKTIILITDEEREWFKEYILFNINKDLNQRPLIPLVSIDAVCRKFSHINSSIELDMLDDMIKLSYQDNYIFWYIGKGDDKNADIAKRKSDSYLWLFDEDYQNSFKLSSYDSELDIKLLQLYKLFDDAINASMFGEVDVTT